MTLLVAALVRPGDVVVDFCAGGGHQSLPLAYALRAVEPPVRFVLVALGVDRYVLVVKASDHYVLPRHLYRCASCSSTSASTVTS